MWRKYEPTSFQDKLLLGFSKRYLEANNKEFFRKCAKTHTIKVLPETIKNH